MCVYPLSFYYLPVFCMLTMWKATGKSWDCNRNFLRYLLVQGRCLSQEEVNVTAEMLATGTKWRTPSS
jgi:hypothetical protein